MLDMYSLQGYNDLFYQYILTLLMTVLEDLRNIYKVIYYNNSGLLMNFIQISGVYREFLRFKKKPFATAF
jgi:hypothetical protein